MTDASPAEQTRQTPGPTEIRETLRQIVSNFDTASASNMQGDGYSFFIHFTRALHAALGLYYLNAGQLDQWPDPKNAIRGMPNEMEKKFIEALFPTVTIEDANPIKDKFIDWIVSLAEEIGGKFGEVALIEPVGAFEKRLKEIYRRDYLYNFRPVLGIKNAYRSPDPSRFQGEPGFLTQFLLDHHIQSIIDLRGEREANLSQSLANSIDNHGIKRIILDFNESGGNSNTSDSDAQGATGYVRKLIVRPQTVVKTVRALLNIDGAILFHCASGKDRTGVMAAVLQKVAGVPDEQVIDDYSRSGHDTLPEKILEVLKYLRKKGGVEPYLRKCGLTEGEIEALKRKLIATKA